LCVFTNHDVRWEPEKLTVVPIACRRLFGHISDRTFGQRWPTAERERDQLSLSADFESRILVARLPRQDAGDSQAVDGRKLTHVTKIGYGSFRLSLLQPGVKAYTRVTDALNTAFKRELGNIIARMHRVDFSKPVDPMSMTGGGGGSPYIKDLADKLGFIRVELLNRMSLGDFMKEW
jgi:hypothetical protein